MDDRTSRQQIDELADLYLTGVINEADQQQADPGADSPVEGPAPIRLAPKPGGGEASNNQAPPLAPETPGDVPDDRHPVLRLTDSNNPQASADAIDESTSDVVDDEPAPRAALEAVLLGNLPGMSGPWLTQYAQLIAQTEGPVALLHVGESAIDLELVEPRPEAEPAPASPPVGVRIPPMRGNKTGLVGLLDALTRSDSAPTQTILVRLEPGNDSQTLSRFAAIEDWTLLCGSDETSVAGASQQLRGMIHADPRLADRSVGLMVMGSDEASANDAAGRVTQQVQEDLVNRVEFIGHLKRMQPVQVREIGSFPDPVGVWPQLVAWFDTLEAPEPQPAIDTVVAEPTPPAPTPPAAPARPEPEPPRPQRLSAAAARLGTPASAASRPELQPAFKPSPPRTPDAQPPAPTPAPRTVTRAPQTSPPASATHREPAVTPEAAAPTRPAPRPRVLASQPELDLIALVGQGPAALDDPAVLEARIPDEPDAQLAVDHDGVVHILMRHDAGEAASTDARQAVMRLIEAGRWVREHLELLALTQRDRGFIDHDPVLHLLTDRADLTTQLVGKLAGQVRLHLLQQVRLGRESGWFCTPLG